MSMGLTYRAILTRQKQKVAYCKSLFKEPSAFKKLFPMKKIILLFFFLAGTASLHAQDYVPLLENNKVWNIFEDWLYWGETYPHYLERCETDTTRFIVKKEWHSNNIEDLGYLFEDTAAQKVYYTDMYDNEVLLYDFSLVEGEVFQGMLDVYKVDTIQLQDETYRKRIVFDEGGYNYWIEGIGSYRGGLLWHDWHFKKHIPEAWLLCYYENDTLLYIDDLFDTCDLSFTEVETLNSSFTPTIYPNPFSEKLSISFENHMYGDNLEIMVKTLDGRVVYTRTLNSDISLDLSFLGKGIYLLVLTNRELLYTTKIIKL